MREIARRSQEDRRDLFRAAAQAMRVHEAAAESRKDYEAMQAMLFGEIPQFDQILTELATLERTINKSGRDA